LKYINRYASHSPIYTEPQLLSNLLTSTYEITKRNLASFLISFKNFEQD